jgi:hypothetical protein
MRITANLMLALNLAGCATADEMYMPDGSIILVCFCRALQRKSEFGLCQQARLTELSLDNSQQAMGDIEALPIKSTNLGNVADMKFAAADEWLQVRWGNRRFTSRLWKAPMPHVERM